MSADSSSPSPRVSAFHSTHWSLVLRAGQAASAEADAALSALCERYWYPLYAFVRRRVADPHEAQDLTQAFFVRLLEQQLVERADAERGRFRSFLLTSLKHFLSHEWERGRAEKRGGDARLLSLDFDSGESRLSLEPSHDLTAERRYERQWALTLLDRVMTRLQGELEAAGKGNQFEVLKPALTGSRDGPAYASLGAELGISEEAARQAGHRLRKRYRELLREEVAQTVSEPDEVDDELRSLFEALAE